MESEKNRPTANLHPTIAFGIAGADKPHRCPGCWATTDRARWALWLPRLCRDCGIVVLTRFPRRIYGVCFPAKHAR